MRDSHQVTELKNRKKIVSSCIRQHAVSFAPLNRTLDNRHVTMHLQRTICTLALAVLSLPVGAHSPICDCFDNGDGSITCEGGFSDGASATGVSINVYDGSGKMLVIGTMSETSEFTFDMPDVAYRVVFDAGKGHTVEIDGRDIED